MSNVCARLYPIVMYHNKHRVHFIHSIHTDSLPVVAGAAPMVENWSVRERTQVRAEVSQTTRTKGILLVHIVTAHNKCIYTYCFYCQHVHAWDSRIRLIVH